MVKEKGESKILRYLFAHYLVTLMTVAKSTVLKLLNMQFSSSACYFVSLRSTYSPHIPIPERLNLNYSYRVRDQFSHPNNIRGEIRVLYILICTILDRQEDNIFRTEWWQAFPQFNLLLTSSEYNLKFLLTFSNNPIQTCLQFQIIYDNLSIVILPRILVTRYEQIAAQNIK
jgi:hypothetical protein